MDSQAASWEALIKLVSEMKRKAPGAQQPRHTKTIGEVASTAQQSDSLAQPLNQCFSWRREDGDDVVLTLHVQPGAKRTEIQGIYDDALKVRLAAPPVDGKANQALLRFLAEAFGVGLRAVTLEHGQSARHKVVRIVAPTKRPDRQWAASL